MFLLFLRFTAFFYVLSVFPLQKGRVFKGGKEIINMEKSFASVLLLISVVSIVLVSGCTVYLEEKIAKYTSGKISEPVLSFNPPGYSFTPGQYHNPEYQLPLTELPENYQRDIVNKFGKSLTQTQQAQLFENGIVILPGEEYDRFENAYTYLSTRWDRPNNDMEGVPIFITTDSVMHLFHIEFNEMLKNIEMKKLIPMLKEFLDKTIKESIAQYNGLEDQELKELVRRNVAYLSVAKKLLDPTYAIPSMVASEVNEEIKRIEDHKGFYRNPLFSKDCPDVCENLLYPGDYPDEDGCNQMVKDAEVNYQGNIWLFQDLYREVCIKTCYCEDYSQYVPRGHYTLNNELRQYFKSMMWLGRMTFKAKGEEWTKQAILLTDAVKSAESFELWDKIYTVTGFFAGASDDLTFYEYDKAIFNLFSYEFDENKELKQQVAEKMQEEIRKLRGPKILGGFEFDLAGNLKDKTQGLRVIGQRYAIDSHVLSDIVYNNVGPNPASPYYDEVLDYCVTTSCLGYPVCSEPKEFYQSCESMSVNKTKYWNEVCDAAIENYCGCMGCSEGTPLETIEKLYSVCRFMPTGLDVMSALGSKRAADILAEQKISTYCSYDEKIKEMKDLVNSYKEEWTENLYNSWLWMLQPVIMEKPTGYPNWMRSLLWKTKDLSTALSSWAQLRHDTILYIKQSYTTAVMGTLGAGPGPFESRYYGYVEPNPELYARAKFIVEYLINGLEEQGVMTEDVKNALEQSKEMMARLQDISEKELEGKALSEEDYNYIKSIDKTFNNIIEDLASALTVTEGVPLPGSITKTSLEGADDAFKTTIIADVHTETNTKKVMEVGTGKIDWILVAHASKDGRIGMAVGPIFSYYEFPWKMSDRLTDEKWREMLTAEPPERPDWIADFIF